MREFPYSRLGKMQPLFNQVGGLTALALCTLMAGFIIIAATKAASPVAWDGIVFLISWVLVVGWIVGLTLINNYPTVWVGDDHLEISAFLVTREQIRWADIIDIRPIRSSPAGDVVVLARHITPVHRLHGWVYARTLRPAFIIGRGIEHREELIAEIKRRAQEAQIRS